MNKLILFELNAGWSVYNTTGSSAIVQKGLATCAKKGKETETVLTLRLMSFKQAKPIDLNLICN